MSKFLFLILVLLFSTSHAYTDLQLLLKLKSSLIAPNGSGLEDWKPLPSPSAHCSFSGVTCDSSSRVVALNLTSRHGFFGFIPPEIGLLNKLVNFSLPCLNLTGKLPLQLAQLTSLKLLNISNNAFVGGFPGEITLAMPNLEIIDIYNNNFSGSLPLEVVLLKNLKHLHLGGNYFSGSIPEEYSEIQSLEYLALNGNGLTGKVPASLAKLKNLRELYLGYFNSYEGGIPSEFGSLSSLQYLDMGQCNLTGEIPPSLGQLENLVSLFLQENHLSGHIPVELSSLVNLKSLDLSINELRGEIPANFSRLKNITLIHIFRNHIEGPIPEFIGDFPHLEVLHIWENNFTFELPKNLGLNGKLKMIDVSINHLTGTIPSHLCKGGRLEELVLMNNFFFGSLPQGLGQCKSLLRFRVGNNLLTGSIPAGIFSLPKMIVLELNDNFFSGELPAEMSGAALGLMKISNNQINGSIPGNLMNLKTLHALDLQNNQLTGQIPEEIFNLKSLAKINISANNLSGEIPASISRCTSLISVDISRNNLSGEIPEEIAKLKDLGTLNISHNQLTGEIPDKIRFMTSLSVLDFSYNNLLGILPSAGQFAVFNDSSFIGNPHLCFPHRVYCAPSGHGHKEAFNTRKLIVTISALASAVLLMALIAYILRKKRLQKSKAWKLTAFQRLDFKAEDVLECLKEGNVIGKGGAGIVYRGSMPDGSDVAIKLLVGRGSGRSDHGFSAEIQTLGRIRHRYIVKLLGSVSNKDTNLLLYEYMPNGSLGELLHGSKGGHLKWESRYRIAVEAAKGLCYLHHDCSPLIIHRDVKSNNILLDSDFEAHVADFGLAKFLQDAGESQCMSSVAGSYGYIAPEYAYTLKVDEKSDVYSFGVVLLELIAGKKPVGEFGEGVDIVRWVQNTTSELPQPSDAASVLAIMDSRLIQYPLPSVVHLFKIAMMCVEDESSARPTMREVVHMLTNPPTACAKPALPLVCTEV